MVMHWLWIILSLHIDLWALGTFLWLASVLHSWSSGAKITPYLDTHGWGRAALCRPQKAILTLSESSIERAFNVANQYLDLERRGRQDWMSNSYSVEAFRECIFLQSIQFQKETPLTTTKDLSPPKYLNLFHRQSQLFISNFSEQCDKWFKGDLGGQASVNGGHVPARFDVKLRMADDASIQYLNAKRSPDSKNHWSWLDSNECQRSFKTEGTFKGTLEPFKPRVKRQQNLIYHLSVCLDLDARYSHVFQRWRILKKVGFYE